MIKKSFVKAFFTGFLLIIAFTACASKGPAKEAAAAAEEPVAEDLQEQGFLYIPQDDEMSAIINNWRYLKTCDTGENQLDEDQLRMLFSMLGRDDLASLQMENFFRDLKNPLLKQDVSQYIKNNNINTPYAQSLIKKYNSVEKKYDQSGHEEIRYSYQDKEFDENITLYDFNEIRPFEDEFGLLLFNNNWVVMTPKKAEDDSPTGEKSVYLMHGGQTNCLSVIIKEMEGIADKEAFASVINEFINQKKEGEQKDEWSFYELNKNGVLERCGVDDYIIYSRVGPDIIPEISAGTFGAYLYSQKYQKIYKYEFFINFSKININYELRQRIFDYVRFFTLFGYCD